jgi:hypothetical protein
VGFGVFCTTGYGRVANNENQCNQYCRLLFEMKNNYIKYKKEIPDEKEVETYDMHISECNNQIQYQLEWKEQGWFYRSIISPPFPNFIKIDEVAYQQNSIKNYYSNPIIMPLVFTSSVPPILTRTSSGSISFSSVISSINLVELFIIYPIPKRNNADAPINAEYLICGLRPNKLNIVYYNREKIFNQDFFKANSFGIQFFCQCSI